MPVPVIQNSFASGELSPKLRSRMDASKYHSGAALMRNWFVDFMGGGASTRQGTRFVAQTGGRGARLVSFQASATLGFVLEFGGGYIRFYSNGAQILSGGLPYQIASPYAVADLFPNPLTGNPGLKFVQDVTSLIITHPTYPPYILTIVSANVWTLTQITFGTTIGAPAAPTMTVSITGTGWYYNYVVTAVDVNGQESAASGPGVVSNVGDLATATGGAITAAWPAVPGATSYNVYRTSPSGAVIPAGVVYGFIGNTIGTSFVDSPPGFAPDFSQTPPIVANPFSGAGVATYTITANGVYTSVPTVAVGAPPSGGAQAVAQASLGITSVAFASHDGSGDVTTFGNNDPNGSLLMLVDGVVLTITSTALVTSGGGIWAWQVNGVTIQSPGSITSVGMAVPTNPVTPSSCTVTGFRSIGTGFHLNFVWGVTALNPLSKGAGYLTAPSVTIGTGTSATATATAVLGAAGGNPGVATFYQQRLMFADKVQAVQSYDMSQPGNYFNFNYSNPPQPDDAISGTIVSEELNDIRSLVPVQAGVIALTGQGAWLINGGGGVSTSTPITVENQTASPQSFNGANDLRPIKINFDILYCTNKGAYFRDMTYNIYANTYTGADISVWSSHLFFNYYFLDIAWAEEPHKLLYVVRNDGVLLTLAFVKDQEIVGWSKHDTNGTFKSVATVIEAVNGNVVDAVYFIVGRNIGPNYVEYVERLADRYFLHGMADAWSVDCALQTVPAVAEGPGLTVSGNASVIGNAVTVSDAVNAPFTSGMVGWRLDTSDGGVYTIATYVATNQVTATVVRVPNTYNIYTSAVTWSPAWYNVWQPVTVISGLGQLAGMTVTGVADGVVVPPTVVSGGGTLTLGSPAAKVTLGLAFTPQLQTLPINVPGGEAVAGRRKKFVNVTLHVADTLGLQIGSNLGVLTVVKDLQLGAIPSGSTGMGQTVGDLVNQSLLPGGQLIDAWVAMDPLWQEIGQFYVQQNLPYPATVLGITPVVVVSDEQSVGRGRAQ